MVADSCAELRDVAIVGGGCYGSFYTSQLEKARSAGRVRYRQLLVVDRDPACIVGRMPGDPARRVVVSEWDAFFDDFLSSPDRAPDDTIVPSPLMPHLMLHWLMRRAQRRWPSRAIDAVPFGTPLGSPYETVAPDQTRYVSFADWLCPVHCVEPHLCPATSAPRTWEMGESLERHGASDPAIGAVLLFTCRHRINGVGMFSVGEALEADRRMADAGTRTGMDVLVGTVSACHGAVTRLRLGTE